MQSKLLVSFILFLFPSLIAPVLVLFFLTIVPGPVGAFFKDYAAFFLWGCYLLLLVGWTIFYRKMRAMARREQAQALAGEAAQE
ncbi:MAG TPA: hypothetical protein VF099_01295 [Ktedonobacterales bacterium]